MFMSGADPTAELLYHVELAASMTSVALWQTWTWLTLLTCGLAGALPRPGYDRESAMFLGSIAVGQILALDSVLIGFTIAGEPRVGVDDPDSPYLPVLVALVAWLVHLPMGLWVPRLGIRGLESLGRLDGAAKRTGAGAMMSCEYLRRYGRPHPRLPPRCGGEGEPSGKLTVCSPSPSQGGGGRGVGAPQQRYRAIVSRRRPASGSPAA
jgi:hypothetical protein